MNTPLTPTTMQPNTQYQNPADGQQYTFKQLNPDGSALMVNQNTQEESVLPANTLQEQQIDNGNPSAGLKPVMKTTRQIMAHEIDNILNGEHDEKNHLGTPEMANAVQDHLMDDIDTEMQEIERGAQGIEGDINEIVEDAGLFNDLAPETGKDPVDVINKIEIPDGAETTSVPAEDIGHHPHKFELSTDKPLAVASVPHRSWLEIRKGLTTKGQVAAAERQVAHLKRAGLQHLAKDLGIKLDDRTPDASGHSQQGIPLSGPKSEKDMTIGMTEFPKDQKRDDSVGLDTGEGYNIPMKDMDENQVADREKFDNEHRQYLDRMTIRQFRAIMDGTDKKEVNAIEKGKGLQSERQPVKSEENDQYAIEKKAIAMALGLSTTAIDLASEPPVESTSPIKDAPIQHKPLQKAPSQKEYVEPGIIQPAQKDVKVFLDMFMQNYQKVQELSDALQTELAPLQKQVVDVQTKHMPEIDAKKKMVKDAMEMAYNAISQTEDAMVHYQEEIWVALQHVKTVKPAVTVPQIIAHFEKLNPSIADAVKAAQDVLGKEGSSQVRERSLVEFPPSKSHEKRLQPESSLLVVAMHELVQSLLDIASQFVAINAELETALAELR